MQKIFGFLEFYRVLTRTEGEGGK